MYKWALSPPRSAPRAGGSQGLSPDHSCFPTQSHCPGWGWGTSNMVVMSEYLVFISSPQEVRLQ